MNDFENEVKRAREVAKHRRSEEAERLEATRKADSQRLDDDAAHTEAVRVFEIESCRRLAEAGRLTARAALKKFGRSGFWLLEARSHDHSSGADYSSFSEVYHSGMTLKPDGSILSWGGALTNRGTKLFAKKGIETVLSTSPFFGSSWFERFGTSDLTLPKERKEAPHRNEIDFLQDRETQVLRRLAEFVAEHELDLSQAD